MLWLITEKEIVLHDDNLKAIENLIKAASLNHGSILPSYIKRNCFALLQAGFKEKDKKYKQKLLN